MEKDHELPALTGRRNKARLSAPSPGEIPYSRGDTLG